MNRLFPGLCFAALTLAFMASGASAQSGVPILIGDCRGGIANVQLREIAAFDVIFRNVTKTQADEFRLAIARRGSRITTFDIRGTFLPNKDMRKALRKTVGQGRVAYESADYTCSVLHVHFTNGKTWDPR
jgi:hypothetical protein